MDKIVKCVLIDTDNVLITEIVEMDAEIGDPNCKLINPLLFNSLDDMKPWKGDVTNQSQGTVKPFHCWDFDDNTLKNIVGTVEVISTQPVIAERHCHYQSIHQGAVVGEYGVVIGE